MSNGSQFQNSQQFPTNNQLSWLSCLIPTQFQNQNNFKNDECKEDPFLQDTVDEVKNSFTQGKTKSKSKLSNYKNQPQEIFKNNQKHLTLNNAGFEVINKNEQTAKFLMG
eukprot:TRINITY_DN16045_c0_g1_i1.p5 TRINITY_DN16045_c0_g1~~TRINITY_DN16045_c0_g1_i1.p5  ORF type:complete len:110 (-),score=22.51 TRINITY_DN16045_c0_g1_i1:22-351(-)